MAKSVEESASSLCGVISLGITTAVYSGECGHLQECCGWSSQQESVFARFAALALMDANGGGQPRSKVNIPQDWEGIKAMFVNKNMSQHSPSYKLLLPPAQESRNSS